MSLLCAIYLGANAPMQLKGLGLCFATGLGFGLIALLYLRKAGKLERALTDLFATLALGAGFLMCAELFLGGVPELYGLVGYLAGTAALPLIAATVRKRLSKRKEKKGK